MLDKSLCDNFHKALCCEYEEEGIFYFFLNKRTNMEQCFLWTHELTRTALVSLLSWPGKGVYTARQTQLPIIVNRIKKSNGFHSTIAMQSFRKGFLRDMQPMDFCALSGGGFAPILRAGFFSDVADMETPILEDTAMNNPFCLGSSPLRFWFGELKIGCSPENYIYDLLGINGIKNIYYHLLCQFPSCREASYFQETGPPGFGLLSGKMIESALSIEKVEPKNHFCFLFCL